MGTGACDACGGGAWATWVGACEQWGPDVGGTLTQPDEKQSYFKPMKDLDIKE